MPGYLHIAYMRFPFFSAGYSPNQVLSATNVISAFLICFVAAYSINFSSRGVAPRVIVPARLFNATLFCVAAAVVAGAMLGFGSLLRENRDMTVSDVLASPSILIMEAIARCCSFYAFIFAVFSFQHKKDAAKLFTLLTASSVFILFNLPLSITRFLLGSYIITTFMVFLPFKRIQKLALATALVASQGTIFLISAIFQGEI